MTNRSCFHADESFVNPITREFQVVRITEDEAGYTPVSENRDLAFCVATAKAMNNEHGLTEQDVLNIRDSSMRAHVASKQDTIDGFNVVYTSVNENGDMYDTHTNIGAALAMLAEFPNDSVVITLASN